MTNTISAAGTSTKFVTAPVKNINSRIVYADTDSTPFQFLCMDPTGAVMYGARAETDLQQSTDFGITWTTIETFAEKVRGILFLDSGEVLVTTEDWDAVQSMVYKSSGWATSHANATFSKKLTTVGGRIAGNWGLNGAGNVIVCCEYGQQTSASTLAVAGRRVYVSVDAGDTWTQKLDITTLTNNRDGVHMHGCAYDPDWDRIWVTYGDTLSSSTALPVLYSDDRGTTWVKEAQQPEYWGTFTDTSYFQDTMIFVTPLAIFTLSDSGPFGIRTRIKTGTKTTKTYLPPITTFLTDGAFAAGAIGQNIWQKKQANGVGPMMAATQCGPDWGPAWVAYSPDGGFTWDLVWADDSTRWRAPIAMGIGTNGKAYWGYTDSGSAVLFEGTIS